MPKVADGPAAGRLREVNLERQPSTKLDNALGALRPGDLAVVAA
jgi:hypothetical protein